MQAALSVVPKYKSRVVVGGTQIIEMTPKEWSEIEDCVCQRDTAAHADKIERHLKVARPEHRHVNAFLFDDGSMMKANGHTRSLLWDQGRIPAPAHVLVIVERCSTDKETIRARYSTFDNQTSVETKQDRVTGAAKMHKLEFKSTYLKDGRFSAAMTPVTPVHIEDDNKVLFWIEPLMALDLLHPNRRTFINPVMSIYLATYHARGQEALKFWKEFIDKDGGNMANGRYNSILALKHWLDLMKAKGWGNHASTKMIRSVALGVFEAWYRNRDTSYTELEMKNLHKNAEMNLATYKADHGL